MNADSFRVLLDLGLINVTSHFSLGKTSSSFRTVFFSSIFRALLFSLNTICYNDGIAFKLFSKDYLTALHRFLLLYRHMKLCYFRIESTMCCTLLFRILQNTMKKIT